MCRWLLNQKQSVLSDQLVAGWGIFRFVWLIVRQKWVVGKTEEAGEHCFYFFCLFFPFCFHDTVPQTQGFPPGNHFLGPKCFQAKCNKEYAWLAALLVPADCAAEFLYFLAIVSWPFVYSDFGLHSVTQGKITSENNPVSHCQENCKSRILLFSTTREIM